jgi:hypothetical protein
MPKALFAALKKVLTGAIARRDRLAVLSAAQSALVSAVLLARSMACLAFLIGAIVTAIIGGIATTTERLPELDKRKRSRTYPAPFSLPVFF